MLFCDFDGKKSNTLIISYSRRSFVFITALFFNVIGPCTTVSVTKLFEKAEYKEADFSGVDVSGSFDIKTRSQVFCITLGPVTI